jgi:hypothetical protein
MEIRGPATENDPYSYFTIIPWFYEEKGSHFSFEFNLFRFKTFFVPVRTVTAVFLEHFGGMGAWQVQFDSKQTSPRLVRTSLSGTVPSGTGWSPGMDIIFLVSQDPEKPQIDRFIQEAGDRVGPGRLIGILSDVFEPPVVLLKNGNRWTIACRDPGLRVELMLSLFARVAEKILEKHGIAGRVRSVPRDSAERFMSRGQVHWWMKGRLEGAAVVIEGDGLRPGELTSADWALVTVPFEVP